MTMIRLVAYPMAFMLTLQLNIVPDTQSNDLRPLATGAHVTGGDWEAHRLVDWAVARFAAAGLKLPAFDVVIHDDKTGCDGHLGLTYNTADGATLHLCTPADGRGVVDRLTLVHELGHVWVAENVDAAMRSRFMQLHGLEAWWDAHDGWARQGVEWAAETVAWAVFDEGLRMIGEVDDDRSKVHSGYVMLTGQAVREVCHDNSTPAPANRDRTTHRIDPGSLIELQPLTIEELGERWNWAAERRGLPTGFPALETRPGSVVVTGYVTRAVELVVVTDGTGGVRVASLVGNASNQYESYDTLLAWRLLLEALRPDQAGAVEPGRFDPGLVERSGRLRGTVHLP